MRHAPGHLLHLPLQVDGDVFAARHHARELAHALQLDQTDQIRVATAVSELCRTFVLEPAPGEISFAVAEGRFAIRLRVASGSRIAGSDAVQRALAAVGRLLDEVAQVSADEVLLTKRLPNPPDPAELEEIALKLNSATGSSALDELRVQNLDLMRTLEQLTAKQEDLLRLNAELQETNRGVMAMYAQLSSELEETNRGVVALHGELYERGEELRFASSAKSRFLASVSHELRSPLNSVLAVARLLLEPDSEPLTPTQHMQLGLIESSAREQLDLVNGLLDLAKAESGALHPTWENVDLHTTVEEVRAALLPLSQGAVALVVDVDPELEKVCTDRVLLAQLLRNLMHNALAFTEDGEVRVTARLVGDDVVLCVQDTGIGISQEHHDLVFEEFFQVPGPLQARRRGTGLGLSYARRIATVLGGTLELQSEPGKGSRFTVTLPRRPS